MSTDELHEIFETTQERLIALYITSGLSILAGCITIRGVIILWKLRSLPFIMKRHPILVLATTLSLIIILLIERPLSAFSRLTRFASLELSWIRWVLHLICVQTQYICVLFRIYITFFDVSFAKTNAASLWVKYIDIHTKCTKSSWIVANYSKYGNLHKIYRYIIALIVVAIVIAIILSAVDIAIGFVFNAIFLFLCSVLMCVLWGMTPRYLDNFKIRVEIRKVLVIQVCLSITNAVYVINAAINDGISYSLWFILHCVAIAFTCMLALTQTNWVLRKFKISVKKQLVRDTENSVTETYAQNKANVSKLDDDRDKEDLELELDIIDIISEPIGFEAFMSHLHKEFSMENLLALIEFNQFKQRYREIREVKCCLDTGVDPLNRDRKSSAKGSSKITKIMTKMMKKLSVGVVDDIETEDGADGEELNAPQDAMNDEDESQKKEEASVTIEAEKTEITKLKTDPDPPAAMKRAGTLLNVSEQVVTLPDTVPRSTIVYGGGYDSEDEVNNIEKIKQMELKTEAIRIISLLFPKYIVVGCEMELNLSHRLRRRYLNKLSRIDEMNEIQIEHMFDRCIVALLKLMQDSYSRFKETKDFIRYEEKAKKRFRNESLINRDSLGGVFADLM